jgi:hypothetical protein
LAAESSTLGDADVGDVERRGEETVEVDLRCSSREQDAGPVYDAVFSKAHVLQGAEEEGSVDRVIGLGEVRVKEPGREAELKQAGAEAEMISDVGGDVATPKEG